MFTIFPCVVRMSWGELVGHPFWQGALQHLTRDLETDAEVLSIRESVRQSIANFSVQASSTSDLPRTNNSAFGHIHMVETQRTLGTGRDLGHDDITEVEDVTEDHTGEWLHIFCFFLFLCIRLQ